jgi:hypothetical protein
MPVVGRNQPIAPQWPKAVGAATLAPDGLANAPAFGGTTLTPGAVTLTPGGLANTPAQGPAPSPAS